MRRRQEVCHYSLEFPDDYAGRKIRCPQCIAPAEIPAPASPDRTVPDETRLCPFCAEPIRMKARKCRWCGEILDRQLAVAKQQERLREIQRRREILLKEAPGAKGSLILGIVGLILGPYALIGFLLGPIAIAMALSARRAIRQKPRLEGRGIGHCGTHPGHPHHPGHHRPVGDQPPLLFRLLPGLMFLPLDRRINAHQPWATFGLVAANTACFFVFIWSAGSVPRIQELWQRFGNTPSRPSLSAAVTHLFIHANWEHLTGNMLFLVFLGMNCERRLGPAPYLGFYFLSGLGALSLFEALNPHGTIPLGGASGAIAGVAVMYLVLFPRIEVEILWFALVAAGTLRIPAWIFSLLWAGCEVAQAALLDGTNYNVANIAHAGGFLVGVGATAILLKIYRYAGRPETPAPGLEPAERMDRFEELAYPPLLPYHEPPGKPETAAPSAPSRPTFFLVARRFDPPPPEVETFLPPGGPHPTPA